MGDDLTSKLEKLEQEIAILDERNQRIYAEENEKVRKQKRESQKITDKAYYELKAKVDLFKKLDEAEN